jgi:hypothetical protein
MNHPGKVILYAVVGEFSDLTDLGDLTCAKVRLLLNAAPCSSD